MRVVSSIVSVVLLLAAGAPAVAQYDSPLIEVPPIIGYQPIVFGSTRCERAELSRYRPDSPAPIIIQLHDHDAINEYDDIDTTWLPGQLLDNGLGIASIDRCYDEDLQGCDFVGNLARGIRAIVDEANERGFDTQRIVLVSRGWGANGALLLATDPSYFEAEGLDFSSIRAVIVIEGHGFDFAEARRSESNYALGRVRRYLGANLEDVSALSPANHLETPNVANVLFVTRDRDQAGIMRAEEFSEALRARGVRANITEVGRTRLRVMSTYLGHRAHPETSTIERFIADSVEQEAATEAGENP